MHVIRAILVIILAFSVATLPAVGGIALAPSAHASSQGVGQHHDTAASEAKTAA